MGRHRKNKTEKITIAHNPVEHNISHLKIPFFLKVTYKEKISEDNNGKPLYGTSDEIVRYSHFTKDEITKQFQEKSLEVINFEEVTIRFPDMCPQCHTLGIPKIEKKSNKYDYHIRSGYGFHKPLGTSKTEVNRHDEYWLTYDHKINDELKKCRIAKFDKNHMLFITSKNKINELHKHFFPYFIEEMKKQNSI